MLGDVDDIRIALVARLTAAFAVEIDRREPDAPTTWPLWPTVAAMIDHLGRNYLWAVRIVSTGAAVDRKTLPRAPTSGMRAWYESCRADMLAALDDVPADRPCWVVGERPAGTAAFWRRRMVFETVKHLIDLRAAGGGSWRVAPELAPLDYADGIDELFAEFLPRSRPSLDPLPGPMSMIATDIDRRWTITPDWDVSADAFADARGARVSGTAGDLALLVWERADPFDPRFGIDGDQAVVCAFAAAPVQP